MKFRGVEDINNVEEVLPIKLQTHYDNLTRTNYYYEPFIVPPINPKDMISKHFVIQNIWYGALDTILRASEIEIIGYSLPPSDFMTEVLLRQALGGSLSKKKKEIKIVNISTDPLFWERMDTLFSGHSVTYFEGVSTLKYLSE